LTLRDFVIEDLTYKGIPLVTASRYKKDVLGLILLGYRKAGWSAAGALKFLNKHLPERIPNALAYTTLLRNANKYWCSKCDRVLSLECFSSNTSTNSGRSAYCKECQALQELPYSVAKTAKYKASKLNALPVWANLNKIKEIYSLCPIGHEVDHIVPLQGLTVCGLHVEYNLQYLTVEENRKKSNSLIS
jgi:5-methylcytosine-specific restriction endonuclease McrA